MGVRFGDVSGTGIRHVLNKANKKLLRGFQATDYRVEFTKWWVNEFKTVKFPTNGTVFDCYIDTETKQFVPWTQRLGRFELDHDMPLQVTMFNILHKICAIV